MRLLPPSELHLEMLFEPDFVHVPPSSGSTPDAEANGQAE